jgi:hypothetical protein
MAGLSQKDDAAPPAFRQPAQREFGKKRPSKQRHSPKTLSKKKPHENGRENS